MNTEAMVNMFIKDEEIEWEQLDVNVRRKIMAYNDDLMVVKVDFKTGGIGELHKHPHSQISHVESGVFEIQIGNEKKELKAGDAFYAPSNIIHGARCLEAGVLIDVFSPKREDFIKRL